MTDLSTELAFWASIGAMPEDQLRRLVFADWCDENAKDVECGRCHGTGHDYDDGGELTRPWCSHCKGTGRISDGRADLAAALRATADRVPGEYDAKADGSGAMYCWWNCFSDQLQHPDDVPGAVFERLSPTLASEWPDLKDYPTPEAAIHDLCTAWVKVHRTGAKA